jgi:aquaporin Z
MEVLLTAGLVSTILGTASGARNIGPDGAVAVGGAGEWGMNEPGSLPGPDLIRGDVGTTSIDTAAAIVGALTAVVSQFEIV